MKEEDKKQYLVAAIMAGAAMFTLAGYEMIRTSATVLFKAAYGAENLPLVMAVMPLVVLAGVALYSRLLTWYGPKKTLVITGLGSALLILICYALVMMGIKEVTPALYLLKEVYIVLLIEQYWSYINSSVSEETGKKVNGPITGIGGLGAALGASFVAYTAKDLGTETMLVFAALAIGPAILVSVYGFNRCGEPTLEGMAGADGAKHESKSAKSEQGMGWGLLKREPKLACLLAIVLLAQVLAAVLDIKFQEVLSLEFAGRPDDETAYQGQFWSVLNSSVLLLQFVLAPLLLKFLPLRLIHIAMPLVHLAAISYAFIAPSVASISVAFFLFKAFDYSLFRAAKELIYVPMGFDMRYRAKELIDVFGYRSGKGLSSVAIVLLQRAGIVMSNYYLVIALLAAGLWLALVIPLTSTERRNKGDALPDAAASSK